MQDGMTHEAVVRFEYGSIRFNIEPLFWGAGESWEAGVIEMLEKMFPMAEEIEVHKLEE